MEVKHFNLREDFKLLISLGSEYGGEAFNLTFRAGKYSQKSYVCSYDGESEYTNCEKVDDKHVLCVFDDHGLPCGLLACETKIFMPDTSMEDGQYLVCSTQLVEFLINNVAYHLELTNGKSDIVDTVEATFELLGPVLKGDPGADGSPGEDGKSAYDIAVEHGFEGTEEEWLESLKGAGEIKAMKERLAELEEKVSKMDGDDPEEDPTVADTLPEIAQVLTGINPETDKVKDMIDNAVASEDTQDTTEYGDVF